MLNMSKRVQFNLSIKPFVCGWCDDMKLGTVLHVERTSLIRDDRNRVPQLLRSVRDVTCRKTTFLRKNSATSEVPTECKGVASTYCVRWSMTATIHRQPAKDGCQLLRFFVRKESSSVVPNSQCMTQLYESLSAGTMARSRRSKLGASQHLASQEIQMVPLQAKQT